MIQNDNHLREYLMSRRVIGIASSTLKKELSILQLFLNETLKDLSEITTKDVRDYFNSINKLKASTIETRVIVLKSFFVYLQEQKVIEHNPTLFLKCPKIPLRVPQTISVSEVEELLSVPSSSSFYDLRDKAILEVLYGTGIRQSELGGLKLNDIDFDSKIMLIYGKGNKERLIPLTARVITALKDYIIKGRTQKIDIPNQWLWLNHFGYQFCKSKFSRLVQSYAVKAGLSKSVSCHTLRRSFATHLLQRGVNPYHISKLLGHSGLQTIDHYLAVSVDDLRQLHL